MHDLMKLHQITYSSIFSYFIESVAFNGKVLNNLKSSEPYQYPLSNEVRRILLKEVEQSHVHLKTCIVPSQSSHHIANGELT